jgi:hypothetical protein
MFTWAQSGRILPDGGALVGEFGEGRIYRIGSDGSVVETWGRKGEGPGEYQASAILSDGRLLLAPGEGYSALAETRPEWVFQTQPILALDLEGGTATTLVELPHLRRWYGTRGGSPGPVQVKGRAGGFAEGFAWARSDEREARWYDHTGQLVQVARWDEEPASLTSEWRSEMRRVFEDAYRSRGAEESFIAARLAELEEGLDRHEGPLPYWDQLHVDRMGNVWLSRYSPLGQVPEEWRVLDRDGAFRGWVKLPGVVSILDITEDRILAIRLDELDVPAAMMFELIKP